MTAEKGNQYAKREGVSRLVRVRLPAADDFDLINEALTTEERGTLLLEATQKEWSRALEIVADCGRCGEPITAAEPEIYWDGERICQSCRDIALAAQGE